MRIDGELGHTFLVVLLVAACGSEEAGAGSEAGTGTGGGATTAASGASTAVASGSASSVGAGSGTGGGGGSTGSLQVQTTGTESSGETSTGPGGGAGGSDGGSGPTPEQCWELDTYEDCDAAGCGYFENATEAISVVDGVCVVDDSGNACFGVGGGLFVPGMVVRLFSAEGPDVFRVRNTPIVEGWSGCDDVTAPDHLACCCSGPTGMTDFSICEGITPLPAD